MQNNNPARGSLKIFIKHRLLAHSGIPHKVPDAVLELLVRTFRDLRANGEKKTSMDILTVSYTHLDVYKRQALNTRSCRTEIMPATTDTALKPCQR